MYNQVIEQELTGLRSDRPRRKQNVPVVLSHNEVARLLACATGVYLLLAQILYGAGLRISEGCGLRYKDVDLENRMFMVWHSKHKHSRSVRMPESIVPALERQLKQVEWWWRRDCEDGVGGVMVPWLNNKGDQTPSFELQHYWLFPSSKLSRDPKTGCIARFHIDQDNAGSQIKATAKRAKITHGISQIKVHAAGGPNGSYNGYRTWPRFGFDCPVSRMTQGMIDKIDKAYPNAETVLDIMETKSGRDWWKENGEEMSGMTFDLSPGSRSLEVFGRYLLNYDKLGKDFGV